jgi:rSAM/selenodomain-associated transferase 2/rSAM/selenodomain-associated transferase 1
MNAGRDEFHELPWSKAALILFTRFPVPGEAKTRLIPVLGADGAARLQRRLTLRALRSAEFWRAKAGPKANLEIHFAGANKAAMAHWVGDRFCFCSQDEGDLGKRMASAFEASFSSGSQATVIIGADCPQLTSGILSEAFERLREDPVVLGPANDGGYYLIGLRRFVPELFSGPAWGTNTVLAASVEILQRLGLKPGLLQPLGDIDRPEDLPIWSRILNTEESDLDKISVIIPALNEAENIGATLASAAQDKPHEIIVVDGGSADQTVRVASEAGATVLESQPGRAKQMNAGAVCATSNVLLFVHADTLLPRGYSACAAQCLREPGTAAGAFRFSVGHPFPGSKWIEQTTNLRSRWLQMPYGDQGLIVRRSLFEELGGFADLPILEDYELIRRLRQHGRVTTLPQATRTSARRWRQLGFLRTTLINSRVILAYHLGWPFEKLAATYRKPRNAETLKR